MNIEVYMDVPAARDIAKQIGNVSDVLAQAEKSLRAYTDVLSKSGFTGLVGAAAAVQIIDGLMPLLAQMAEKCTDLSKDVDTSVSTYEKGDELGATRFY